MWLRFFSLAGCIPYLHFHNWEVWLFIDVYTWTIPNFAGPSLAQPKYNQLLYYYRHVYNIRRTLVGNNILDHSDVVGASPVGAAPTISSFSIWHLAFIGLGKDSCKTRRETFKFGESVPLILEIFGIAFKKSNTWPNMQPQVHAISPVKCAHCVCYGLSKLQHHRFTSYDWPYPLQACIFTISFTWH